MFLEVQCSKSLESRRDFNTVMIVLRNMHNL